MCLNVLQHKSHFSSPRILVSAISVLIDGVGGSGVGV